MCLQWPFLEWPFLCFFLAGETEIRPKCTVCYIAGDNVSKGLRVKKVILF